MTATREMQVAEAARRLRILEKKGLHPNVRADFERDGLVNYSERTRLGKSDPYGVLYWVTNDTATSSTGKAFADVIAEFEQQYNALVYHATHEYFTFGECLDLFYVSQHEEEWESDRDDLDDGISYVYAANLSVDDFSEIGAIRFSVVLGGLIRTS